jgi:hypothetical protein
MEEEIKPVQHKIFDLEDYYADSFLSGELREIYKKIQEDNTSFRENIFLKNFIYLENHLVKDCLIIGNVSKN